MLTVNMALGLGATLCVMALSAGAQEALLARWSGNGAAEFEVTDLSDNRSHLVLGDGESTGAPTQVTGCLDFNGLTDYATPGAPATLQDYTNGVTVLAWAFPHDQLLSRNRYIVHQDARLQLGVDADWRPTGAVSTGRWQSVGAGELLRLDAWSHVALAYDGAAIRLYVNGALVKETEAAGSIVSSGSRPLYVGKCAYADNNHWCGLLGQIEIFAAPLDEARIRERMSATRPKTLPAGYRLKATLVKQPFIANGGFEGLSGASFRVAGGWRWNTWGENTWDFSEEVDDVHGGTSCQKIEVTAFTDGGVVLCQLGGPVLEAGTRYKLEVWLKGNDSAGQATVQVRQATWKPLPGFGRTFDVTTAWRRYRVLGQVEKNGIGNVAISFRPERAGILWVDDITLTPME